LLAGDEPSLGAPTPTPSGIESTVAPRSRITAPFCAMVTLSGFALSEYRLTWVAGGVVATGRPFQSA
jgi:hypothetical protein